MNALDWQDEDRGGLRTVRRLTTLSILGLVLASCGLGTTMWQVANSVDRASFVTEQTQVLAGLAKLEATSQALNAASVAELAQHYVLNNLHLGAKAEATEIAVAVPSGLAADGILLIWQSERPGQRVLAEFAPTRAPILLLIAAGVAALLYYLNRIAAQLDRQRRRARQLAGMDPLTGLANRLNFDQALSHLLETPNRHFALLCLDLDGFKAVNDRLGHAAGDAVLQAVAARLMALAAPDDMVVRLGGDEFAIVRRLGLSRRALANFGQTIMDSVERPFLLGDKTALVGVSIGIALADEQGRSSSTLMALADSALYRAKARTGSSLSFASGGQTLTDEAVAA